jgi:hypothetical protein
MVALPFVLLLFGILSVCLYFFTTFTLEKRRLARGAGHSHPAGAAIPGRLFDRDHERGPQEAV